MYLAASDLAVAAVLVREENNKQLPVYYVSKALSDTEARYINAEKLAYSLVIAYFEAHPIKVLTDSPLKKILHKPDVSGRLLK